MQNKRVGQLNGGARITTPRYVYIESFLGLKMGYQSTMRKG